MRLLISLALIALAQAALACPPPEDRSDERAALHTRLLSARTEAEADRIAGELWRIWLDAPDARAQGLLDLGIAARERQALAESEATLDALIGYCPAYAEGFNQRAFTRYLRGDHAGSLADLEVVLDADPYHFGALSGRALNLMRQGRAGPAQRALRDAVRVHPFLRERQLIVDDGSADPI
ncbi:hypothetical protein GE300_18245 [Rhodobacteraceae bacterium 2CG4]|uniref:Uncharacterized protein n=1 Tax=Halovulum marinum TaxID=2662447 RepID=A0A6L5Z4P5_9RHOB|nr:hypothetical protein [Halovulum marinum]MSU91523.1 hypothetical protein [Halovulum marinum]